MKVLLFLDVGGSMDAHVKACDELFSAARSEFQRTSSISTSYNFTYERVWKDNARRHAQTISARGPAGTYSRDYRAVFVGDATMSPYEIALEGGSVEHYNEGVGRPG